MLTQTAKYAIRALIHLAEQDGNGYYQTQGIAEAIKVPANYLGKTMQKLANGRILDSQKGLHGGFRLARTPRRISLHEIMVAIEAIPREMMQDPMLDDDELFSLPSAVYGKFAELSLIYNQFLKGTTLADLCDPERMDAATHSTAMN